MISKASSGFKNLQLADNRSMIGSKELNIFQQCSTALKMDGRQRCNFMDRRQWQERRQAEYSNPTDYTGHGHWPKSGSRDFMKNENEALFLPCTVR